MDFETQVKLAIYGHFAETGQAPRASEVALKLGAGEDEILSAYAELRALRVLVLADDGASIRMAPPFSGVPTQHVVESDGIRYYANCAWDALGVPAALGRQAVVRSRCAQSREPLILDVSRDGPEPSGWWFHCLVPAAHWWDDIVFT